MLFKLPSAYRLKKCIPQILFLYFGNLSEHNYTGVCATIFELQKNSLLVGKVGKSKYIFPIVFSCFARAKLRVFRFFARGGGYPSSFELPYKLDSLVLKNTCISNSQARRLENLSKEIQHNNHNANIVF